MLKSTIILFCRLYIVIESQKIMSLYNKLHLKCLPVEVPLLVDPFVDCFVEVIPGAEVALAVEDSPSDVEVSCGVEDIP